MKSGAFSWIAYIALASLLLVSTCSAVVGDFSSGAGDKTDQSE